MKTLYIFRSGMLLLLFTLALSSCYEENLWLEDNIVPSGEYYPLIYMNSFDSSSYRTGGEVDVLLEFSSLGELQEIVLYEKIGEQEREEVSRTPYQPAFSQLKSQDTLLLRYTVPAVADTVSVMLEAEAINANGLSRSSAQTFEAIP